MIIVFGAIYTDMVMRMEKFPDPGETVVTKQSYHYVPGGKGANQALAASRAGKKVLLAGTIGDDQHGALALTLLQSADVDLSAVNMSSAPTGCSSIFVNSHGENMICSATGANKDVRADQVTDKMLQDADALVLQCEAPVKECAKLASRAKAYGLKVILNVAPAINVPDYYLKNIDYLVMNEVEAEFVGAARNLTNLNSLASIWSQQKQLVMIVTQGKDGGVLALNGAVSHFSAPKVDAIDSTAAGDTFIGYLAAGIISKEFDIETAIEIACKAASICCTRHGSQPSIPFYSEFT